MAGPPVLIAAFSARALAEAASRAGFKPYAADLFGDVDTAAVCPAPVQVAGDLRQGFEPDALLAALERLENLTPEPPIGLVYGGGFEAAPDLLDAMARRWRFVGNPASVVRHVKDPFASASACRALAVPHPAIYREAPSGGRPALAKTIGGAGGSHVRRAGVETPRAGVFYQDEVAGRAVSALFVADGRGANLVGLSEQWTAPAPGQPFRYGGAAQPARVSGGAAAAMHDAAYKLAPHFGLRGLNSADFIFDGEAARLLEINPRPGATLDIFDDSERPLLALHIEPGPAGVSRDAGARAAAIVYADWGPLITAGARVLPNWTKDRPQPGSHIAAHQPVCTVLANAATVSDARKVCARRRHFAQALFYENQQR